MTFNREGFRSVLLIIVFASPFFLLWILFKWLLKGIPERLGHRAANGFVCSRTCLPVPGMYLWCTYFDLCIGRLKFSAPWLIIITELYLLSSNSKCGNSCPKLVSARRRRAGGYLDITEAVWDTEKLSKSPQNLIFFLF